MFQQMLDLDGDVVGEAGMLGMKIFHQSHRVSRTIEKIGIAEGDVLGARGHLAANVFEHNIPLYDSESSAVHRYHRTMPAQMFAAAAGLGVPGDFFLAR